MCECKKVEDKLNKLALLFVCISPFRDCEVCPIGNTCDCYEKGGMHVDEVAKCRPNLIRWYRGDE